MPSPACPRSAPSTIAPSGANLAITFNLKVDGVNATDFSTSNRALPL